MEELAAKQSFQIILERGNAYSQFFTGATTKTNPAAAEVYRTRIQGREGEAYVSIVNSAVNDQLLSDSQNVWFGESEGTKLLLEGYPCRVTKMKS